MPCPERSAEALRFTTSSQRLKAESEARSFRRPGLFTDDDAELQIAQLIGDVAKRQRLSQQRDAYPRAEKARAGTSAIRSGAPSRASSFFGLMPSSF